MAAALLVVALGVSAAIALDQTNGSGLTHEGASLGFNAKLHLRGEITYTSHDGTEFQVFCRGGLPSYRNLAPTYPDAWLTTCNSGVPITEACNDKGIITAGNVQIITGSPQKRSGRGHRRTALIVEVVRFVPGHRCMTDRGPGLVARAHAFARACVPRLRRAPRPTEPHWYGGRTMRVAVIGATGAVGREMLRILEERRFPVDELLPLASARSAGRLIEFAGEQHEVRELTPGSAHHVDVAFVSAGASISKACAPDIAASGAVCIDNSSAFRMDPRVPLSVPEVNPEALDGWPHPGIIAVPNCTTITTVLPLGPLHRAATCTSLVLSSYQAVSGAGWKGTRELAEQVEKLGNDIGSLTHPDHDALPDGHVFAKPIAFNVVAKVGEFEPDGFTGEESKMMAEPRKILGAPDMRVVATSVRVPVVTGHAVSMVAEFSRPITVEEARELLDAAPGVRLMDDPGAGVFPTPLDAAGGDDALVGRIRQVLGRDDALALFSCADNLRMGAALDAIQIAEHLFTR